MKISPQMIAELDIDLSKIIEKCEEKAEAAKDTLEEIYAERRTRDNYGLRMKDEDKARRDRQRYCQWRDAWNQVARDVAASKRYA